MTDVVVAICTYRRPDRLAVLLDRLQHQAFPSGRTPAVEVLVVDNSPDFEGETPAGASRGPLDVRYVRHGAGNISSGRNETLRQCVDRADFVALIDDDETPTPDWLDQLLDAQARTDADVVTGPVLAQYPQGTAPWLQQDEFYSVVGPSELTPVDEAVSGNALIKCDLVKRLDLWFDESLGTSGGEDQLFFRRARAGGGRLWYAPQAVVHESVPAERLRLSYLLRREFRKGTTLGLLDRSRAGWPRGRPGRRVLVSAYWSLGGALRTSTGAVRQDRARTVSGLMRSSRALGMLNGLAGRSFELYSAPAAVRPVIAIVAPEDPGYQAAGHSRYLDGFVRHYLGAGARVVLVVTEPRLGFVMRRRNSLSYLAPWVRSWRGLEVVVAPRAITTTLTWRVFRAAPQRAQKVVDGLRGALRSRRALDHRLGTHLDRRQEAFLGEALQDIAPDVVLFSSLFTAPDPLRLPSSVRASVMINHDVVSERADDLRAKGFRVSPATFSEDDERAALRQFSILTAIQWEDAEAFSRLAPHADVVVVPMAVSAVLSEPAAQPGRCLFVGSGSLHNVDGVRWFIEHCWPEVRKQSPHAELHVVGTVCARLEGAAPGVVLRGEVSDLAAEYQRAAVVLVPLRAGSGLKVKLVEAICHGAAIVTTPVGAQGLGGLVPIPFVVAESAHDFATEVAGLLTDDGGRASLQEAARASAPVFAPQRAFSDLDRVLARAGVGLQSST